MRMVMEPVPEGSCGNRKPTQVLFLREIQTVFGENYNQRVFETENQQNELKVPFLAVILVPFRAPNSQ